MGYGDEKLSKSLTQTFTAHCNALICQQVTLSGDAEWPKVADAVIEALHRTWEGIQRGKDTIQEWLKGMGLELKDAKTRFAHTLEAKEECHGNVGFDFL